MTTSSPRIRVTTVNAEMMGFHITNDQENLYMRDGNPTGIYEQTRAVNEESLTLEQFRKRFSAADRKRMICEYLTNNEGVGPSDYSVREWEQKLMRRLRQAN